MDLAQQASNSKKCLVCGKEFYVKPSHYSRRKCCSRACNNLRKKTMYKGKNNPNFGNRMEKCAAWKGGQKFTKYGYRMLYMPEHPMSQADGYILEHRFVMSEILGRHLREDEHVHHIDGNKLNNSPDNLQLVSKSEHTTLHNLQNPRPRDSKTGRFISGEAKELINGK